VIDDLRVHAPGERRPAASGDHVLYWIQSSLRGEDNHALTFAVEQANRLRLPLLVYHGLTDDYPWASDRLHTFILESAADLHDEFARLGIQYALHLQHDSAPGTSSALTMLARRAALVVTDYFPTFNVPRATRTLRRAVETPVVAVDSATVVPVKYHDREYPTAPPFRTRQARAPAHFGVTSVAPEPEVRRPVELPFDPTVPDRSRVPALVGSSRVDHSVAPVAELGGGTRAAHRRLEHFLTHGLPRYAEDRADPNADATSGLSPYLHFGNISPREVLLRAQEAGPSEHVAKFRDELLTWRELAFNFAHFNPKHRTVEALPGWAREELARGEADPRPAVYSSEELEQARTAEPLWNAAQRAYVRDGWMPNPLRMLWGKAVVQWTRKAGEALAILEHLNNKYALDGRDPSTYLNLQWVLGRFDRPFYRRPIFGTVRSMSLRAAEKKFDVGRVLARYA
jgi:deoxyribodipyrimidine photo-lyase